MRGLGVFLHVLAVAVWLGASLAFMVFGPAARKMPLESWANTWMTLAKLQRAVITPASAVAAVTGLILTMALAHGGADMGSMMWLMVMQGFGLIAAILTIAFVAPLANRMDRLAQRSVEKGEIDPATARVGTALARVGSIAGVMMLVALYFATARP